MRVAILCQYFHPEIGAPSARLYGLARDFKDLGHDVVIVTAFPNHPTGIIPAQYRGKWISREDWDGITVLRNWLYATPNEGFVKKTLSHLSFMVTAVLLAGPRMGKVDAIIVSSPAFFAVISAWVLSVVKRAPFVFEVRDLWPAVFVELGVLRSRWIIGALEFVEMFLYRRSAAVVTVTESFREILVSRGLPVRKVVTITNGVDLDDFKPGPPDAALKAELKAEDKFIVLYIGAHGISQALRTIIEAAKILEKNDDILFLFVGEGAEKAALVERTREWGLGNVRFLAGQPREKVRSYYRTADLCLVPLRNIPLFDSFIPSKMFEILGSARPILASVRGESARILSASKAAMVVAPEDAQAVAQGILTLKKDPALRDAMAGSGRAFVADHYQRRDLALRYSGLLEKIVANRE